jgi:hypothetical protein
MSYFALQSSDAPKIDHGQWIFLKPEKILFPPTRRSLYACTHTAGPRPPGSRSLA